MSSISKLDHCHYCGRGSGLAKLSMFLILIGFFILAMGYATQSAKPGVKAKRIRIGELPLEKHLDTPPKPNPESKRVFGEIEH